MKTTLKTNANCSVSFSQIRMGALYLNDVAQKNPVNPTWDGDIPEYDGTSKISIRDVSVQNPEALITWNVLDNGKKLIADRVLLTSVSWNDLANAGFTNGNPVTLSGKEYICLLFPVGTSTYSRNVWNKAIQQSTSNNDIWHWKGIYFWGSNESTSMDRRAIRGNSSSRGWADGDANKRCAYIGFRPMLIPFTKEETTAIPASVQDSLETIRKILKEESAKNRATAAVVAPKAKAEKSAKTTSVAQKKPAPKQKGMGKMLCESLKVKTNQPFRMGQNWFTVTDDGELRQLSDQNRWNKVKDMDTFAYLINHATDISFTPVLNSKEKTVIQMIAETLGSSQLDDKLLKKAQDGTLDVIGKDGFHLNIPIRPFPSIPFGVFVPLRDVA